jgi:stringent starvation protein A
MTLFSAPNDPWSHRTRIVLAEKGISIDIVSVEPGKLPEDLLDLNPYHTVPTLVDRDLVLYDSRVIIEYLDERFPHPPLMPVDPVTRAQFRLALYRIERDWYGLAHQIDTEPDKKQTVKLKKILRDTILQSTDLSRSSRSSCRTNSRWWTRRSRRSCGACPSSKWTCRPPRSRS